MPMLEASPNIQKDHHSRSWIYSKKLHRVLVRMWEKKRWKTSNRWAELLQTDSSGRSLA